MIQALRRLFSPPSLSPRPRPAGPARAPQSAASAPAITPVRHYFEALNTVDHRAPIPATGIYVHRLLSKFNRLQLASVARYLWDNVGLVFYATDLIAAGWERHQRVSKGPLEAVDSAHPRHPGSAARGKPLGQSPGTGR